MIEISTDKPVSNAPEVPVFSLDGRVYTIPAEIPGWLALQVLHRMRTEGEHVAISWALEELLQEGYHALLAYKGLTTGELKAVLGAVQKRLMGAMEEIQGN